MRTMSAVVVVALAALLCATPAPATLELKWTSPMETFCDLGLSEGETPHEEWLDMDADGIPELILGEMSDTLRITTVYSYEAGGFTLVWSYSDPILNSPEAWGFVDVDGDGVREALIQWHPEHGDGLLRAIDWTTDVVEWETEGSLEGLRDFDGDGVVEVVVNRWSGVQDWVEIWGVGITSVPDPEAGTERRLQLLPNRPNPFDAGTTISYTLGAAAAPEIEIYNVAGRLVRSIRPGEQPAGTHDVVWDGRGNDGSTAAAGTYFYRLAIDGETRERKAVLLR